MIPLLILFIILSSLFFNEGNNHIDYMRNSVVKDSVLYPKQKHREQSKLIHQLLTKYHYKKINLSDSLSIKILDRYIASLDPNKEYLFSSDIKYFSQYDEKIDDYITSGYLEPAYEIFTVYHERVKNRINYVFSMLENEPDFSTLEKFNTDRKETDWFDNVDEMDNYWRKKLKTLS